MLDAALAVINKMARFGGLFLSDPRKPVQRLRRYLCLYRNRFNGTDRVIVSDRNVNFEFDFGLGECPAMAFWGRYQPAVVDTVRALLRPGDTFLDAGASIGYMSFIAAQEVGRRGQVHAFEPVLQYYEKLARLRELNPELPITVNNCALGERDGRAMVYVGTSEDIGWNTMVPGRISRPAEEQHVRVTRLDRYVLDHGLERVRLVKIDVEGYEFQVLKGMRDMLGGPPGARPAIICELLPGSLAAMGVSMGELAEYVRAAAYRSFRIPETRRPANIAEVQGKCDVLLLPAEWR